MNPTMPTGHGIESALKQINDNYRSDLLSDLKEPPSATTVETQDARPVGSLPEEGSGA